MAEWIEWKGGARPTNTGEIVDVRFRDGSGRSGVGGHIFSWLHDGEDDDIVAYRVVKQQSMEEAYDETHKEIGDSALDQQHGGDHYKKLGDYQPWEVLRHWLTPEEFRGYMKGEAITYLARERSKGGTLDINKAAHTLKALLELEGK